MSLKNLCWIGALALLMSCSQSEISLPGSEDAAIPDVGLGDAAPFDGTPSSDGSSTDQENQELPSGGEVSDAGDPAETTLDTVQGCETGSGCFGEPCKGADDCISGWCVDHLGDQVCTETCETDCPQGWSCKEVQTSGGDVAFVCVSDHTHLCRPCADAFGCTSITGIEDVCVDYGPEGKFCGSACAETSDCPSGFECIESTTTAGGSSLQCVNTAGVCDCSEKAINLGLQTTCSVTGEGGTCVGVKTCTVEGLSECSVSAPSEEVCNGVDDDCDGETDEGSCDDGDPCTGDSCDGEACVYDLLTGGPCDDESACTEDDH